MAIKGAYTVKYFSLEGEHLVPFSELENLLPKQHAFLQKVYDAGHFLFSGPQIPPHGGFLVARAESLEALNALLTEEPFVKASKMRFKRITEFFPAQSQPELKKWFGQ